MKGLRILHGIGIVASGVGLAAIIYGHLQVAAALIALSTLIQFGSLEALRVLATTTARKVKP